MKYSTAKHPQLLALNGYKNGNIAAMYWEIGGRDRQAYGYRYDELDRLKGAYYADIDKYGKYYNKGIYQEGIAGGPIQYDKIGNILSLKRNGAYSQCDENGNTFYGFGLIDNLSYTYNADKTHLINVTDAVTGDAGKHGFVAPGGDYEYDYNGNMTSDEGKGIEIKYNYLNLPREVVKTTGDETGTIKWVYDATGRKLKKTVSSSISENSLSILYLDGIEKHSNNDIFVMHAEGRVAYYFPGTSAQAPPPEWQYEYSLRDHLGNSRAMIADKNNDGYIQLTGTDWSGADYEGPEIIQENHYYPFGLFTYPQY